MSIAPVEFTIGQGETQLRLRHHPLPGIPLVREHHKLMKRIDGESGTLDTLAFTFSAADHAEMWAATPSGIFRIVKTVSMLLNVEGLDPVEVPDDADPELVQVLPIDDGLPTSLAALCLYYARLGKVEIEVSIGGEKSWTDLQTEDRYNALPQQLAIYVATFHVLKGLFVPFAELLPALSEKVTERLSGSDSSNSEESSEPTAPT